MIYIPKYELMRFVCERDGEIVEWVSRGHSITYWLTERGYEILSVAAANAVTMLGLVG